MAAPTIISDIKKNFNASALVNNNEAALRATAQEGLSHKVSSENLDKISGSGGFKFIPTTTAQTGLLYKGIVINADAVISAISIDGVDSLSDLGLSGVTISAGMYLPAPLGSVFTAVTLTSGTAIGYN
jgi:hypothetical protein